MSFSDVCYDVCERERRRRLSQGFSFGLVTNMHYMVVCGVPLIRQGAMHVYFDGALSLLSNTSPLLYSAASAKRWDISLVALPDL